MEVRFGIQFECNAAIRPHLESIFNRGEYDVPISLPQGSKILDLGANAGAFSVWASHRWPGCPIEAFEPNPQTFEVLSRNIINYPNVKAHAYGVGIPGWRVLRDGRFNDGECSFHEMANNPAATGQHCEVKGPEILPPCNIIKLDIEGCEVEVLRPYIAKGNRPEIILLEYHSDQLRREVDSILTDYFLIGSEVQHPAGRGVLKYMHGNIHQEVFA